MSQESKAILNRRYVTQAEISTYSLYRLGTAFAGSIGSGYFILNVFKLDPKLMASISFFLMFWDIFNDIPFATLVDRTRTRFGKFRPWVLATILPMYVCTLLVWLSPYVVSADGYAPDAWQKGVYWALLSVASETIGTLYGASYGGLLSCISPNPQDKVRMIKSSNLVKEIFGKLPDQLTDLFFDLSNKGVIKLSVGMVYTVAGVLTNTISYISQGAFAIVAKERLVQSSDRPSVLDGIRTVITNKPLLLLTLSEFLGAFGDLGGPFSDLFYRDVLGFATAKNLVGIPGGATTYIGYGMINWWKKHFNTKQLWFISKATPQIMWILVFIIGYDYCDNLWVMFPLLAITETLSNVVIGIKRLIPEEINQETIDYAEWKTGKRNEATIGAARGLITKLVRQTQNSVSTALVGMIGYQQGTGIKQTFRTKQAIFAMFTVVPIITGSLSFIPMIFYDLVGEKRDKMYEELLARRAQIAKESSIAHEVPTEG